MFNLNDGRWGRGDEPSSSNGDRPAGNRPPDADPPGAPTPPPSGNNNNGNRPRGQGPNQGPPDLDELWRDLNRKLGGFFGGKGGGNRPNGNNSGGGGNGYRPDMKNAGFGLGLVAAVAILIWLGTGFFIVNEGQQAVVTQFGRYKSTVNAGFNWRLPYPIQRHEVVVTTQIRSTDVGRDAIVRSTGLRESAMLTEDENIVEIKFAVQYRLSNAQAWLYESKSPAETIVQVAESSVREVVGKMKMDAALAEERDQIAPRVRQ
jgi:membrane protease subunit HflK